MILTSYIDTEAHLEMLQYDSYLKEYIQEGITPKFIKRIFERFKEAFFRLMNKIAIKLGKKPPPETVKDNLTPEQRSFIEKTKFVLNEIKKAISQLIPSKQSLIKGAGVAGIVLTLNSIGAGILEMRKNNTKISFNTKGAVEFTNAIITSYKNLYAYLHRSNAEVFETTKDLGDTEKWLTRLSGVMSILTRYFIQSFGMIVVAITPDALVKEKRILDREKRKRKIKYS